MADPLCLDHDGHYMDNSTKEFMKLTSSISQAQSTATTHTVTTYQSSSDHKSSEGPKRNKFHWNFFNYYNSPSIPETNEDDDNKTSMNGTIVQTIPPAPPVPVQEVTTSQPVSSGQKTKVKPGSSLSAEVNRQQLTGAQFTSISHLINSGEVAKYFESSQSGDSPLKKANSFSDFDFMKEPFRERTNSASSSASLPPTPVGSPKQLRRSSSASSLQKLEQVTEKMRDERFFTDRNDAAVVQHVKEKKKADNDHVFQNSNEDSSLIRRSSREIVPADNQKRGVLKDAAKFLEPQHEDHSNRNANAQNSESLLSKIQRWGTTTQMQMRNKDVNAWAPGGF